MLTHTYIGLLSVKTGLISWILRKLLLNITKFVTQSLVYLNIFCNL